MLVCAQSDEGARAGTAIVRRRRLRRPCLCWRQHWSPSLGKCMLYAALVPTILALTLIQAGGATAACREVAQRRRQKQEREQRSSCLPWELLQGAEGAPRRRPEPWPWDRRVHCASCSCSCGAGAGAGASRG